MLREKRLAICAVFVVAWPCLAHAQPIEPLLDRLKDLQETQKLEAAVAVAVRSKDRVALKRIAASVRGDVQLFTPLVSESNTARNELALKLGPCHYAGLYVRIIAQSFADRSVKPKIFKDYIDVMPSKFADGFAENMSRCERLAKSPNSGRLIGSTCAIDGRNCGPND